MDLAHASNTMWVLHKWSTVINTIASLHIVAACPDAFLLENKQGPNPLVYELSKQKLAVKNWEMLIPDGTGRDSEYRSPNPYLTDTEGLTNWEVIRGESI